MSGERHPDFAAGNALALRHGAWSPRKWQPLAEQLVALVDDDPGVTWIRPADRPLLWSWAEARAREQLVAEYLVDLGDLDDGQAVRAASDLLTRLRNQSANLGARLGLEPLARAKLGRDTAASAVDAVAALQATGAAVWAARAAAEAAGASLPPGTGTGAETSDERPEMGS